MTRNRTSSGDRRKAEAARSKHQYDLIPAYATGIDYFLKMKDQIRFYLDDRQLVEAERLPNTLGWEKAGRELELTYHGMKITARRAARVQERENDCTCLPDADACPNCREVIRTKYGEEIPYGRSSHERILL